MSALLTLFIFIVFAALMFPRKVPALISIPTMAILIAAGLIPAIAVLAAAMAIVQLQNVCDPTNTHNVWVANYVGVRVEELTKSTILTMIAICFVGLIIGALMFLK